MISKIKGFFSEVRTEMQKVTWPTRQELTSSTYIVLVTMLILSTFIGAADFVFSNAVSAILR